MQCFREARFPGDCNKKECSREGRCRTAANTLRLDEKELIRARISELDRTAYEQNILKCSVFLSYAEQQAYHSLLTAGKLLCGTHFLSGGYPGAERCMAFFLPDYMEKEDAEKDRISCVLARAAGEKYAENLTHRDYLGALMNLGMERDCLGDILVAGSSAYIFCTREMAGFITDNLFKVKHTAVSCEAAEPEDLDLKPKLEELKLNVASERIDVVIAALWKLSRQKASALVDAEQVFINGITVSSAGRQMKEGDRVSVRGLGKFIYDGVDGSSRKGRLYVAVRKYV